MYVNSFLTYVNSFCIAIDNRNVPINIRSLYDTENCYDHHTNGIDHAEQRVQLLQNPSPYGASNGFGECRTYNYLFTKTGHKPTEAFTQRKSDCFSLVACCRRAVQEPLRGVNELHTIKYPVTAERIASDQIFRPGIPDFG